MNSSEIANRATGLGGLNEGVPVRPLDRKVARRVVTFLEDRAVLYDPYEVEVPQQCVESITRIRSLLTAILGDEPITDELAASLRAMRTACRRFLRAAPSGSWDGLTRAGDAMGDLVFNQALGELRGVFGVHLAVMAVTYRLDVEDALARILPLDDASDDRRG